MAIRTRERESQVVEGRNCHTSGSTARGYSINLGETLGALRGPSGAAPSKGATCEGEGSIWKPKGSASKSEGYGSRGEALPEYYRDKTAGGSTNRAPGTEKNWLRLEDGQNTLAA